MLRGRRRRGKEGSGSGGVEDETGLEEGGRKYSCGGREGMGSSYWEGERWRGEVK